MNYELFMGEALAEARNAIAAGERLNAAVAVVDEAMVARAHDRVLESNDPTAHAVIVALREAARKLGRERLADATIFTIVEPCPMCVGALLESDVAALVFAMPNDTEGAAGTIIQLAQHPDRSPDRRVVAGRDWSRTLATRLDAPMRRRAPPIDPPMHGMCHPMIEFVHPLPRVRPGALPANDSDSGEPHGFI
jgi:tRNA(adenine34) deaminase